MIKKGNRYLSFIRNYNKYVKGEYESFPAQVIQEYNSVIAKEEQEDLKRLVKSKIQESEKHPCSCAACENAGDEYCP